jgi:predicted nucleotidyltransferase
MKTIGLESLLKKALSNIQGVSRAFIFGSYARYSMDASSDIDVLVIGNHDIISLQKSLTKLQKKIDREINLINITQDEFEEKKANGDGFIRHVLENKKIELL